MEKEKKMLTNETHIGPIIFGRRFGGCYRLGI
jgi:hypothetical protein